MSTTLKFCDSSASRTICRLSSLSSTTRAWGYVVLNIAGSPAQHVGWDEIALTALSSRYQIALVGNEIVGAERLLQVTGKPPVDHICWCFVVVISGDRDDLGRVVLGVLSYDFERVVPVPV